MNVNLLVNGKEYSVDVAPDECLADTLREKLHILSVKKGCENGDCGACTVLVNMEAIASCIYLSAKAQGKEIRTIESFGELGNLHPLQQAFKEAGAFQCGFCAPGVTLSVLALLYKNPFPSEEQIRKAIAGNLCRCSGYVQIVDGVKLYVERAKKIYEQTKS